MRTAAPILLAVIVLAGCAQAPAPVATVEPAPSLAAAESEFAAHSVREGMRAAFIAHFADDGVMVREGWVNAIAFLTPRPDPGILLDWRPQYTETAASGEMGLSTGPWKLTSKTQPDAAPSYGQFVSIWRREPGRPWKVTVDLGISHPEATLWDRPLQAVALRGGVRAGPAIEAAEERFAADTRASGTRSAYARSGAENLRFYRGGFAPLLGKAAALASPAMTDERYVWTIERTDIARSGDFGYARGSFAAASAPAKTLGRFMRAWRVEGGEWRIALDVTVVPRP
jgi:ketosteroid isomerase-like protein